MRRRPGIGPAARRGCLAAACAVLLASCSGGMLAAADRGAERIAIGDDIFSVTVSGRSAVVRNFATGAFNQARLYRNAEAAAAAVSGCEVVQIAQRPGLNVYDARLDCR